MLKKRIAEISIMNLDKIPHDRAAFGSTVQLAKTTATSHLSARHAEEADAAKGLISTSSPIGRAIVGRTKATRSKSPRRAAPATSRSSSSSLSTTRRELFTTPENCRSADRHGTGGAYHAGVLRALHEAGIKIDVMSGRGIGVVCALFAAIDAGAKTGRTGGVAPQAATRIYDGGRRCSGAALSRSPLWPYWRSRCWCSATALVAYPSASSSRW
jgi:hypothetical protein